MPTRIQFMTPDWEPVRINPEKVDHIAPHPTIPGVSVIHLAGVAAGGGPLTAWVMGTVEDIEALLVAPVSKAAPPEEEAVLKGEDRD